MKIEQVKPNIIQLKFQQEKSDKDYGSCLLGNITLNCDTYTLMAETDCGKYVHSWTPTPDEESFIHLLCRIESEYLVGKISVRNVFDFEESKRQTYEIIRQSRDCRENAEQIIEDIEYALGNGNYRSEESFYRTCNNILKENGAYYSSEMICIEKDYPVGAKIFAEIYDTAIKPYLRSLKETFESLCCEKSPMRIEVKNGDIGAFALCPNCEINLYHFAENTQRLDNIKFCPYCGQMLSWG